MYAATIHEVNARTNPLQAAMMAPVPDAFFHVIKFHNGITADPITIPMNRYTHPRFKPNKRTEQKVYDNNGNYKFVSVLYWKQVLIWYE